jgi:hypothetical protein
LGSGVIAVAIAGGAILLFGVSTVTVVTVVVLNAVMIAAATL